MNSFVRNWKMSEMVKSDKRGIYEKWTREKRFLFLEIDLAALNIDKDLQLTADFGRLQITKSQISGKFREIGFTNISFLQNYCPNTLYWWTRLLAFYCF